MAVLERKQQSPETNAEKQTSMVDVTAGDRWKKATNVLGSEQQRSFQSSRAGARVPQPMNQKQKQYMNKKRETYAKNKKKGKKTLDDGKVSCSSSAEKKKNRTYLAWTNILPCWWHDVGRSAPRQVPSTFLPCRCLTWEGGKVGRCIRKQHLPAVAFDMATT